MPSIKEQFQHNLITDFYEPDTHLGVQGLEIERLQMLNGENPQESILLVMYKHSPNLSFYDMDGKLIDIDHYLPDEYHKRDTEGAGTLMSSLRDLNMNEISIKANFGKLLKTVFDAGEDDLALGFRKTYGLETSKGIVQQFKEQYKLEGPDFTFAEHIATRFFSFYDFLENFIVFQQKIKNGYVHITQSDNIIITPLNKRSGVSVIIETQSRQNTLLPPNQWTITRTDNEETLEQALVFRTNDIRDFFTAEGLNEIVTTERYKLYHSPDHIALDSLLDNTDNMLELSLINDCFHILPSDPNIITALSQEQEVTIVNTHRSIVPSKWPKKLVLPEPCIWMRIDENFNVLFCQNKSGEILLLDITDDQPVEFLRLEACAPGFDLDRAGNLMLKIIGKNQILKVETNLIELELPSDERNLAVALKNLSHLFKGESLFTKTQFAKVVTEEKPVEKKKLLPTAFEAAKYDFEANVEQMLAESNNSYEQLLEIQNKIAIARYNISEELSYEAEQEGITLIGQRLQSAIRTIIGPAERRVRNLVEESRAAIILKDTKSFYKEITKLSDPNAYRDILNTIRGFQEELNKMIPDNVAAVMTEFKRIQEELNATFSAQIVSDGTTLQNFINSEITQIETAIKNTFDPLQLEIILSTHPAALELMTLLKQPYVLQNIAKGKSLSPAGIQTRLYQAVAARKAELSAEVARKEAEKNKAKLQLANMIEESIEFFVKNHSSGFADIDLSGSASYQSLMQDINRLESHFQDVRLAMDMRRKLERRILERNREDLEKLVTYEDKYAFIQNEPDLYIDPESNIRVFPIWTI
ncbi:MAG: hypothetical protein AB8F74_23255, partial [Saprospiraceae bacterium]